MKKPTVVGEKSGRKKNPQERVSFVPGEKKPAGAGLVHFGRTFPV